MNRTLEYSFNKLLWGFTLYKFMERRIIKGILVLSLLFFSIFTYAMEEESLATESTYLLSKEVPNQVVMCETSIELKECCGQNGSIEFYDQSILKNQRESINCKKRKVCLKYTGLYSFCSAGVGTSIAGCACKGAGFLCFAFPGGGALIGALLGSAYGALLSIPLFLIFENEEFLVNLEELENRNWNLPPPILDTHKKNAKNQKYIKIRPEVMDKFIKSVCNECESRSYYNKVIHFPSNIAFVLFLNRLNKVYSKSALKYKVAKTLVNTYSFPKDLVRLLFTYIHFPSKEFVFIVNEAEIYDMFDIVRDLGIDLENVIFPQELVIYCRFLWMEKCGWISLQKTDEFTNECELQDLDENRIPHLLLENCKVVASPTFYLKSPSTMKITTNILMDIVKA